MKEAYLRKILFALVAAGALTGAAVPAEAWGGCGPLRHPTPWGCRVNGYYRGPILFGAGYGRHRPLGWHRHYW